MYRFYYLLLPAIFLIFHFEAKAQCGSNVLGTFPVNIGFNPQNNLCPGQTINFTGSPNQLNNQYVYSWNFGDPASGAANTASTKNASHAFSYNPTAQSYTVTLVVIDTVGDDTCNFDTQIVNVQSGVQVLLDTTDFNLCVTGLNPQTQADTTITFYILSPASGTFVWNFGDGSPLVTSSALTQTHTYNTFGSYLITVTLQGTTCPSFQKVFKWNTNPFTSFQFITNPVMCEGDTVRMINTTLPPDVADSYQWNWGDGTVYTVGDTSRQWHVYSFPINQYCTTNPGNGGTFAYTVTLTGQNNCFSQPISTPVNIKPKAHAEFSFPSVICVGQPATFDNESCPTWGGNVFSWDFGDPAGGAANTFVTNSALVNPTYTYTTPGIYTVTLIAYKTNGCPTPDTIQHNIIVTASPVINVSVTSNNVGCAPFLVTFSNNTTPAVGVNYNWTVSPSTGWSFTGGTNSSSLQPQITFTQAGSYTVSMTAQNQCNSASYSTNILVKNVPILDLASISNQCVSVGGSVNINPPINILNWQNGTTQTYNWTFNNGTPASSTAASPGPIAFAAGTHTVNLTVTNECGSATDATSFTVNEIPQQSVSYVMSDTTGCISAGNPLNVQFTSNWQPFGVSANWQVSPGSGWTYVSGSSGTASATMSFSTVGNYTISHPVSNVCGTSNWSTVISVKAKPTVNLSPQNNICLSAGQTQINLNPSASYNANNAGITAYSWTFNNGTPASSTNANPGTVTFGAGSHTVNVTATNECGSTSATNNFNVTLFPNANANFTGNGVANQNNACIPIGGTFVVQFQNISTGGGLSYNWSISPAVGAGFTLGSAATANPQITITQPGNYTITLTATNLCGSHSKNFPFSISSPPQVSLAAIPNNCGFANVIPSATVTTNNAAISAYSWVFVGGTPATSAAVNPGNIYFAPGNDTAFVTVTNQCGSATAFSAFNIAPPPVVVAMADTTICNNTGAITIWGTPAGGTWTGTNVVQTTTTATATFATFTPTGSGTFNAIYSFGAGNCLTKDTTKITVNLPPVVDAGINFDVCEGDPLVDLTSIGTPLGGFWTDSTGNVLAGNLYNPVLDGNFWLYYHYTSPVTGCSNMDSVIIVVHPLPNIIIPPTKTYCETSSSIILPPGLPTNGYWTGPPGTVSFGNLYQSNVTGVGFDTLWYHYTTQFGCEDSAKMIVTIIPPIPANAGVDSSVCFNGTPIQLTGLPAGGTWYGPGMDTTGLFHPFQTAPGNQFVMYTYGVGDCQTWDTAMVNVLPLPVNIPGTYYGCINDTVINLTNSTPLGGTWVGNFINGTTFYPQQSGLGVTNLLYIVTDSNNCTDTSATTVLITPLPIPLFLAPTYACKNTLVQFQNLSANAGHYLWKFKDGTTDTTTSPIHVFADTGTYQVTLIAFGQTPANCPDSITIPITILDLPVASFLPVPDSGCAVVLGPNLTGMQVNFTDNSLTYSGTYSWQFGNGLTSTSVNPGTITFLEGLNDTMYVVSLAITNMCGSGVDLDTVKIKALPKAIFGTNVSVGCSPAPFAFSNISQGGPNTYSWIFGNGNTSTVQNPGIQYYTAANQDSTYTITLIANNACGSDTAYQSVLVHPNNVTAFFNANPVTGCAPLQVVVTNLSTAPNISYNFGNGSGSAAANTVHTYTLPGTYTLSQYVSDGCSYDTTSTQIVVTPTPQASFSTPSPICFGDTVQFTLNTPGVGGVLYNFGDLSALADTSNAFNPTYLYPQPGSYAVTLSTYSLANNCPSTVIQNVVVNAPPAINFNTSSLIGCVPFTLNISNNNSQGNFHFWDFGNLQSSAAANPSMTYTQAGTFTVTYTNTDNFGCGKDTTFTLTVLPKPASIFAPNQPYACGTPASFSFNNQSTGTALGFDWDFGNAQTSTLQNPSATYNATGTFVVSLITTNNFGCKDTAYQSVTVHPQPQASANVLPLLGCAPMQVTATNGSANANLYTWNWGDGSPLETTLNPNPHTYLVSNPYTVSLVANYQNVCFDTFSTTVNVVPSVIAAFTPTVTSGNICNGPITVTMSNQSQFASNYAWNLGNSTTSSAFEPTVTYTAVGTYTITLIASTGAGCSDTVSQTVTIHPAPNAAAQLIPAQGCQPLLVVATNQTTGASSYEWNWGDGTPTETNFNPNPHTYLNVNTYTVTLIANYQNVCFDTVQIPVTVQPQPVAAFTMATNGNLCGGPITVTTTNNAQFATNYLWIMGNGNQYNTLDVQNELYTVADTFAVSLVASNNVGCSDTATQTFIIHPAPNVQAIVTPNNGCTPLTVQALNQSLGTTSQVWTFGDGTAAEFGFNPNPHIYLTNNTYTLTLIGSYQNVCFDTFTTQVTVLPKPLAGLNLAVTGDICGGPLQVNTTNTSQFASGYLWLMGNGSQYNTFDVQNELYTAADTFTVTLIANNNVGCTDTASKSFILHPKPDAQAIITPTMACPPVVVNCTNQSSNYTSLMWTFGDGTAAEYTTNPQPHTYFVPNTSYNLQLFLNYNNVCFDTLSQVIQTGLPPTAAFSVIDTTGDVCGGPATIYFANQSQNATTYFWNMGDGQQYSNAQNPTATYNVPGGYFIQMIASNQYCKDTATTTYILHPKVFADLMADTTGGCSPLTVQFTSLSQNGQAYIWEFGDGQFSTLQNPLHIYDNPGVYSVNLIANIPGTICADTITYQDYITVTQGPVAAFLYEQTDLVDPFNNVINFLNSSNFATSYSWNFGDGGTSTETNPQHVYGTNDSMWVVMYAYNELGCLDTAMAYISLTPFGDLQVPNAFAPNSGVPGANLFQPKGIGLKEYHIAVYSIWGDLVWESDKLDDMGRPTESWDGTDKNGIPVNSNAFVWKVHKAKFNGNREWGGMRYGRDVNEKAERIGTLTIIR